MLLVNLRNSSVGPFMSRSLLGELVERGEGKIKLENVCVVYEQVLIDQRSGRVMFNSNFYTESMFTNGVIELLEADALWTREVDVDQERTEFLGGYYRALEAFRLEKLNIQKAANMPGPSPVREV